MGFTGRLEQYDPVEERVIRVGFTQISNFADYFTYPKQSKKLDYHWSGLEYFVYLNPDGTLNEWYTRLRHFFFFKNTSTLRFRLNNNYIDLLYPFAITEVPLPAKAYNMTEYNVQYTTGSRKDIWLFLFAVYGEFFEGTKLTTRAQVFFRRQPWGNLMLGLEQNKHCADGESILKTYTPQAFDLCILDVMMPRVDGFMLARKLREMDPQVKFLFLTARSLKEDMLHGFSLGAEDYIRKPFDRDELLCRIGVSMRRNEVTQGDASISPCKFSIGDYLFDYAKQELSWNAEIWRMTEKENEVLRLLCIHQNQILRRDDAV